MAAARAKKSKRRTTRPRRGSSLPVIEVDVDDEQAMNAVAEQIVTAILGAASAAGRPKRAKKAAKKRATSKR